jgi:hypothetical protein
VPPPLDPDKRAAVLVDVQDAADGTNEQSAGAIAKAHGVSVSSVTKIAKTAGLEHAWRRTQTASASRAKTVDNRSRRAALSAAMLNDAERIRLRVWEPTFVVTATGAKVDVDVPVAADVRQLVSAVTAYVKSSLEIDAKDAESEQHAAVDAWLREVIGGDEVEPS